jgi:hypothetical protein
MPDAYALAHTVIESTCHCGFDKLMNSGLETGLRGNGDRHQIYQKMKYAHGDYSFFLDALSLVDLDRGCPTFFFFLRGKAAKFRLDVASMKFKM